jgi:isoleucyl-tRNA synthetase
MSKRLGNAIDPFEMINSFGADPVRWYMISNSNPWDNLKFNADSIPEVRNKFFGTLYNTYGFFCLYANLDNFDYSEADIPLEKRPEIDRWILSELHSLIAKVDAAYEDYEPTRAARAISEFTQEYLSNWFVRLSRRRFWKGIYGADKISAYQTLYTCLLTISKLGAPIAPFFMDRLYKDLTENTTKNGKESVHLSDFPESNSAFIDADLERKMERAQTISSLVLSLRQREKIKVRQPLKKIMIPVLDEITRNEIIAVSDLIKSEVNVKEIELIDEGSGILVKQIKPNFKKLGPHFGKDMKVVAQAIGGFDAGEISLLEKEGKISISVNEKNITLTLEDVEISSQDIEGWLVANNNGITVALDVTITPNLKNEGIARELVNRIQNIRKDAGYEVTDRVEVRILENEILEVAVQENMDYIKQETLTEVLKFVGELEEGTDIAFDDITTKLNIVKH